MIFEIQIAEKWRRHNLPEILHAVHLKEMFPDRKFQTAKEIHEAVIEKGFKTPSKEQAAYLQKLLNPIKIEGRQSLWGLKILNVNRIEGKEDYSFFDNPDIFVVDQDENGRYIQGWKDETLSKYFDPGLFVFLN